MKLRGQRFFKLVSYQQFLLKKLHNPDIYIFEFKTVNIYSYLNHESLQNTLKFSSIKGHKTIKAKRMFQASKKIKQ